MQGIWSDVGGKYFLFLITQQIDGECWAHGIWRCRLEHRTTSTDVPLLTMIRVFTIFHLQAAQRGFILPQIVCRTIELLTLYFYCYGSANKNYARPAEKYLKTLN